MYIIKFKKVFYYSRKNKSKRTCGLHIATKFNSRAEAMNEINEEKLNDYWTISTIKEEIKR